MLSVSVPGGLQLKSPGLSVRHVQQQQQRQRPFHLSMSPCRQGLTARVSRSVVVQSQAKCRPPQESHPPYSRTLLQPSHLLSSAALGLHLLVPQVALAEEFLTVRAPRPLPQSEAEELLAMTENQSPENFLSFLLLAATMLGLFWLTNYALPQLLFKGDQAPVAGASDLAAPGSASSRPTSAGPSMRASSGPVSVRASISRLRGVSGDATAGGALTSGRTEGVASGDGRGAEASQQPGTGFGQARKKKEESKEP